MLYLASNGCFGYFVPMSQLPRIVPTLLVFVVLSVNILAAPVQNQEPRVIMDVSKIKTLTYSPTPDYPKEARKNHWGGSGLFEIHFRRDGLVSAVFVILSTGHKVLDDAASSTLRQWHSWKGYRTIVAAVTIVFAPGGEKPTAKPK